MAKRRKGPRVRLSQLYLRECGEKFGINPFRAVEVATSPDRCENIYFLPDSTWSLVTKRIAARRKPYSLLMMVKAGIEGREVEWGFKIFPSLRAGVEDMEPLTQLGVLTTRFGLPVIIGERESVLFTQEKVPVASHSTNLARIDNPENKSFFAWQVFRYNEFPQRHVDCAITFAIDTGKYLEWLWSQ